MLYGSQLKLLLKNVFPALDIGPGEEIRIASLNEVWGETPQCLIRFWWGRDNEQCMEVEHGVVEAHAVLVGAKGTMPLDVKEDWVFGDRDPVEGEPVPTVGEQLAGRRVAYVIIHRTDSVEIFIGPGSPARYLRWRLMRTAREMCGLLSELEPLCPQRPAAARSRRRLLDAAGK